MTPPVSAAIIAFNEEDKIADCVKSVAFADEIVVVDSHSSDRTREIAASLGAKVIERDWPGHIEQKNFALSKTTNDWVICLDADERISQKLKDEILLELEWPTADGYYIPRRVFYINRWIKRCGWYPAPKVRLVKKSKSAWGGVNPHDTLIVDGSTEKLAGDMYHLSFDSIYDHLKTIDHFTRVGAEEAFKAGRRTRFIDLTLRPLFTFIKMYFLKLGFMDGVPGFIVCVLSGFHTFTKYDRLLRKK
ncbi:MAG: glycosyl transferase [bacterium]|nr:MAG: glycosyl transferase [bacterium]